MRGGSTGHPPGCQTTQQFHQCLQAVGRWHEACEGHGGKGAALSTHLDEAVEFARTLPLDFAVLDVNLNGRMSYPVADTLRLRGVPFIFATGYGPKILVPPYAGTPTLQKPFQIGDLRQMLERMAAA